MNIRRKDKHTNYAPDFQGAQSRELLSLNQEDLLWECRMPFSSIRLGRFNSVKERLPDVF
ncbi:hypothetical protein DMC46_10455 [Escherichia coli]|nr:hypothetical protein [Escherichia coli]EGE1765412.1 hypothetical protein [Escherichia coli]